MPRKKAWTFRESRLGRGHERNAPSRQRRRAPALHSRGALRHFGQLGARGRAHPAKMNCAGAVLDVHAIEEQHMKLHVQIERAAKALNQRDRAGARHVARHVRLVDQMRGDDTVDDGKHAAHDYRLAREQ